MIRAVAERGSRTDDLSAAEAAGELSHVYSTRRRAAGGPIAVGRFRRWMLTQLDPRVCGDDLTGTVQIISTKG